MVAGGGDVTAVRRPRVPLGYALELVAAAAIGFGLLRSQLPRAGSMPAGSGWLRLLGGACVAGLAIVGGLGLAIEAGRGRAPSSWGLGRWVWSIAGLSLLLAVSAKMASIVANRLVARGSVRLEWAEVPDLLGLSAMFLFDGGFAWAIAAVCVTAMFTGVLRDPEADAREWAGRLFASLVVALHLAVLMLRSTGR